MTRIRTSNDMTTVAISWVDKEIIRKYAKPVKHTKNGTTFETDAVVLHRIIEEYSKINQPGDKSNPTYPTKVNSYNLQQN